MPGVESGPAIYLVTGIPASGKTTVAARLATRFPHGVHVDGDALRDMVVAGRSDMSPAPEPEAISQLRLRYRQSVWLAESFFDAGFTVAVQDNVLGPFLAEYVRQITRRPFFVVVLAPRAEAVAARESARAKRAYHRGWSVAELDQGFRETTPRIGLWLDSSELTPDETVEAILARAAEAAR